MISELSIRLVYNTFRLKRGRSVPVTRPMLRGSRIAHCSRTSNAEPTPMSLYNLPWDLPPSFCPQGQMDKTIPWGYL